MATAAFCSLCVVGPAALCGFQYGSDVFFICGTPRIFTPRDTPRGCTSRITPRVACLQCSPRLLPAVDEEEKSTLSTLRSARKTWHGGPLHAAEGGASAGGDDSARTAGPSAAEAEAVRRRRSCSSTLHGSGDLQPSRSLSELPVARGGSRSIVAANATNPPRDPLQGRQSSVKISWHPTSGGSLPVAAPSTCSSQGDTTAEQQRRYSSSSGAQQPAFYSGLRRSGTSSQSFAGLAADSGRSTQQMKAASALDCHSGKGK